MEQPVKKFAGTLINDIDLAYEISKEVASKEERSSKFKKHQRQKLEALAGLVQYENKIYMKREDFMKALGEEQNFIRFFRQIPHLVRYYSSNINRFTGKDVERGYVLVEVHPGLLWRPSNTISRASAIGEWYKLESLSELSKNDPVLSPHYQDQHPTPEIFKKI